MNLDFNLKYVFDNDFDIIEKDDKVLYIDYGNVNWIRTNSTGRDIVNMCDGNISLDEAINKIAADKAFAPEFLKSNFEHFLTEAIDRGLIIEQGKEKEPIKEIVSEYPKDIWVHVTNKCNLSCPFCYSNSRLDGKYELDYKKVLEFLSQIPKEQRDSILISGGEPFLYKDLPQFTQALNGMGFPNIVVITNGTVGEEVYKDVVPNIHTLQISVDGTKAEVHDVTRGKGSFDRIINKFSLAKDLGVKRLMISFTPTKFNITKKNMSFILMACFQPIA